MFLSLLGTALLVLLLLALATTNRLPAPPLTATACIDEKLAFARSAALGEATLIAVGSSATWRNLDMQRLEQAMPTGRALNVATCYLYVDQTAFLSELLLERAAEGHPRLDRAGAARFREVRSARYQNSRAPACSGTP